MITTGICKKCGKEGDWLQMPTINHNNSGRWVLQHYCPVASEERRAKRTRIRDIPQGLGDWREEIRWLQKGRKGKDWQRVQGYEWNVRKLSSEFLRSIGIQDRMSEDLFHPDNDIWADGMDLLTQRVWEYFKKTNKWPVKILVERSELMRRA